MRSDTSLYRMEAPRSLREALDLMASADGALTPIAGGTELMVALNTGRLQTRSLLSLHAVPELRFIRADANAIEIGAGTTFTDIRRHQGIARDLPLLARAASWTGSIANQNRGTLGGNLCNASPAADTPPALLAYGATLKLASAAGERELHYDDFHLGYKQTALHPDELLFSVRITLGFNDCRQYIRKVGTRNAQAISKVALAGVSRWEDGKVTSIRLGAASLADRPLRCVAAEAAITGRAVTEETVRLGRAALTGEARPIDDIRSTAKYRGHVAANLLEEFLRSLSS